MLVDGVGTSLIADAPYAKDVGNAQNLLQGHSKALTSMPKANIIQAPNARAGSMKQQIGQT
jgi:hypothetical protein